MESCWKGSAFLVCCSLRNWSFSNWAISFIQYERIVRSSWSIVSIILQRVLPKIVPYTPREIHVIWERERECCICHVKGLHFGIKVPFLKKILHLPQGGYIFWRKKTRLSTHSSRNTILFWQKDYIRTRTPSWNLTWRFKGILHPFQRDDALSWRNFQIVKNMHIKVIKE